MTTTDIVDAEIVDDSIPIETTALTPRQALIATMHRLLDLLDRNEDLPIPHAFGESKYSDLTFFPGDPKQAAKLVRSIGGKWSKNAPDPTDPAHFNSTHLVMRSVLDEALHVSIVVSRGATCEKKVVGKTMAEVEKVVQPRVTETVLEEVDVFEYNCKSILSFDEQRDMDALEAVAS